MRDRFQITVFEYWSGVQGEVYVWEFIVDEDLQEVRVLCNVFFYICV